MESRDLLSCFAEHHRENMKTEKLAFTGTHIRLEPLDYCHIDGVVVASGADPSLYQWSPVPQGKAEATKYVEAALAWRDAGTAVPFAIIRVDDGAVIGSTRFWNLERWAWPQDHPRHGRSAPDACEIGYTWLTRSAIRTAANTEAKLLMLTHAFETWQVPGSAFTRTFATSVPAPRLNASEASSKESSALTVWPQITSLGTRCDSRSWQRSGRT